MTRARPGPAPGAAPRASHRALHLVVGAVVTALAWSGHARAQAFVELFQVNGQNALTGDQGFNRATCEDGSAIPLLLRLRGLDQPQYLLRLVQYDVGGPQAPCPSDLLEPVRGEVLSQFTVVPTGAELNLERTLAAAELLGSDACGDVGLRANVHLCMQLSVLPGDRQAVLVASLPMDYDTTLPPAVDLDDVTVTPELDALVFEAAAPADDGEAYELIVEYRVCPAEEDDADAGVDADVDDGSGGDGAGEDIESLCGATGSFSTATSDGSGPVTIGGLESGQDIEARFTFVDDLGNVGQPSDLEVYRTSIGAGPLALYDGAGSRMSCAASCSDLMDAAAGFGGLLLVLSRRGRRAWRVLAGPGARARGAGVTAMVVLVAGLASTPARAFTGQTTVGMSVAPYTPAIDDERVGGQRIFPVYECIFSNKETLEFGADVDTHIYDGFGSLQLSFGLGAAQAQGKAQPSRGATCVDPNDVDVQLSMLRVRPGLTYRLDPLLDWVGFPLVPYGRAGLVLQGYAFTMGGDFDQGSVDPIGLRLGWEAAAGVMLALDLLDSLDPFVPDTTRRARANGVFDHTFVFVEGAHQVVDGFGEAGFIFSPRDTLFDTGLPVLWRLGVAVELL